MSVALPELPDDRRAQTGRHSRGEESSGARWDGSADLPVPPESSSPQVPILSATAWPIDGGPPGTRPVEPGAADGRATNGHGVNGHGVNGQGVNGQGVNGHLYERGDTQLATPPYGWGPEPIAADGGRHSAGPTAGAVARPESPDDGWTSGDPTSTTPNGRPVVVGDDLPDPSRSPRSDVRGRYYSDVPPRRPTGPARTHVHDREPPVENGREPGRAEPSTVVFDAVDGGPGSGSDEPPDHHPEPADSYSEGSPDDGSPDFPGRHRRRAGAAAERAGSSRRGRARGAGGGRDGRGGRRRRSSFWKELPVLIVVALVLTFLIQTFLAKVYVIPSGSMETTLHGCSGCNNDRVLVDKVSYRFSDPQPGDVVVFRGPDGWTSEFTPDETANVAVRALQSLGSLVGLAPPDEKDFIKRIIAVGGQTVKCCDSHNRILVNDKPLDEPYLYFLPEAGSARQDSFGPVTVPAGELWVMGDSRNNSADSRVPGHGPIPIADVIGRARLVVLPFARFGTIPSPDPQTTTVGMGSGAAGAPAALGVVALLPLALLRRRTRAGDGFLPRRRT